MPARSRSVANATKVAAAPRLPLATWARGRGWAPSALLPAPDRLDEPARQGIDELIGDHRDLG